MTRYRRRDPERSRPYRDAGTLLGGRRVEHPESAAPTGGYRLQDPPTDDPVAGIEYGLGIGYQLSDEYANGRRGPEAHSNDRTYSGWGEPWQRQQVTDRMFRSVTDLAGAFFDLAWMMLRPLDTARSGRACFNPFSDPRSGTPGARFGSPGYGFGDGLGEFGSVRFRDQHTAPFGPADVASAARPKTSVSIHSKRSVQIDLEATPFPQYEQLEAVLYEKDQQPFDGALDGLELISSYEGVLARFEDQGQPAGDYRGDIRSLRSGETVGAIRLHLA